MNYDIVLIVLSLGNVALTYWAHVYDDTITMLVYQNKQAGTLFLSLGN